MKYTITHRCGHEQTHQISERTVRGVSQQISKIILDPKMAEKWEGEQ